MSHESCIKCHMRIVYIHGLCIIFFFFFELLLAVFVFNILK